MRVPTSVRSALTTTPSSSSPRPIPAPDFACVKVRARPSDVLAALAPFVTGAPRDLLATIHGEPLPPDGRGSEQRAVLYRVDRDAWTTILREGDRFAGCDVALARFLSAALASRAFALFTGGAGHDLALDVFDGGVAESSLLHAAGHDPEVSGAVDREALLRDPVAFVRDWLRREDSTNDRLAFRHFERSGTLRGRWDLSFERCVLLPELAGSFEARPLIQAVRAGEKPKTRKIEKPPALPQGLTREAERGVRGILADLIQQNTQGF